MNFALIVPTYRRPHLLRALIEDITQQCCQPASVIVVDGAPAGGEVLSMLRRLDVPFQILYIPSNHGNLAYQRYVGALKARDHELAVYLDDDLRVFDSNAIARLLAPMVRPSAYVAGTGTIRYPSALTNSEGAVRNRVLDSAKPSAGLIHLLGASRNTKPGGLTPTGNRIPPPLDTEYPEVQWLRGGAMAFRTCIFEESFFSDDLFALTHVRCGLGEDTYLGRRALAYGKVYAANNAVFHHPNQDAPKAYPTGAYDLAFATAYSRRFINDTFRGKGQPYFWDRVSFIRSLAGGALLALARSANGDPVRRAYARGYCYGMLRALTVKPTSKRLAPDIDWRRDAKEAAAALVVLPATRRSEEEG